MQGDRLLSGCGGWVECSGIRCGVAAECAGCVEAFETLIENGVPKTDRPSDRALDERTCQLCDCNRRELWLATPKNGDMVCRSIESRDGKTPADPRVFIGTPQAKRFRERRPPDNGQPPPHCADDALASESHRLVMLN